MSQKIYINFNDELEFENELITINQLRKIDSNRGVWAYKNQKRRQDWNKIVDICLECFKEGYNATLIIRFLEAKVSMNVITGLENMLNILQNIPNKDPIVEWFNKYFSSIILRDPTFLPLQDKEKIYLTSSNFQKIEEIKTTIENNYSDMFETFDNIMRFVDVVANEDQDSEPVIYHEVIENLSPGDINSNYKSIEDSVNNILQLNIHEPIAKMIKNLLSLRDKDIFEIVQIDNWKDILFAVNK